MLHYKSLSINLGVSAYYKTFAESDVWTISQIWCNGCKHAAQIFRFDYELHEIDIMCFLPAYDPQAHLRRLNIPLRAFHADRCIVHPSLPYA